MIHLCDVPRLLEELRPSKGRIAALALLLCSLSPQVLSHAATVSYYETEILFHSGRYEECQQIAAEQVSRGIWNELWPELLIRCHLTVGNYEAAVAVYESQLKRFGNRIAFRMSGVEAYRHANQSPESDAQREKIMRMVQAAPWRYGSMREQVTLGRFLADEGEDARQILEVLYDRIRKQHPKFVDVYLATAELALAKHDDALAMEQLTVAAELQPSNPHVHYLLAESQRESDGAATAAALKRALQINPRHVPSMLLQVDQAIDAEMYDDATAILQRVLEINLRHPKAWSYHAVLAHLAGHYDGERVLREAALSILPDDPIVDHLIGKKLSQKYRFRESVTYQRMALGKRSDYVPAQFQLANDLLRIGEEAEGWRQAAQVQKQDPYHVVAFNLVELKDRLDSFATLTTPNFVVRMDATEAGIYGQQVVRFLETAYDYLCPKYAVRLSQPVHVEIFPRQQDFAIRTFGLPGGAGYLGVCFGPLITANSPVAQGSSPTNWQSILWHEFCHVVTLEKTNNRMPRWLSEGISVYEERQRNPGWGQRMTPQFRQMVLSGELTPVSELSRAFLRPKSGAHLQFAYYESSLVVEFLLQQKRIETLQRILTDLSVGMPINEALERYVGSTEVVNREFAEFAKEQALAYGAKLDWKPGRFADHEPIEVRRQRLTQHPNHYSLAMNVAAHDTEQGDWNSARAILEHIHELHPSDASPQGTMRRLARIYRELDDESAETGMLADLAELDADDIDVRRRLIQLAELSQNWDQVHEYALQMLAVNPMLRSGQRAFVKSAEALDRSDDAIDGRLALLQLEPTDPAAAHFMLADLLLKQQRNAESLRHVLIALEEAPRYRDAHRLLLRLVVQSSSSAESPNPSEATPTQNQESAP